MAVHKSRYFNEATVALLALLALCSVDQANALRIGSRRLGEPDDIVALDKFLTENKDLSANTEILSDDDLNTFNFDSDKDKAEVISEIKAYQRLVRLNPTSPETLALVRSLLEKQVSMTLSISAVQRQILMKQLLGKSDEVASLQSTLGAMKHALQLFNKLLP